MLVAVLYVTSVSIVSVQISCCQRPVKLRGCLCFVCFCLWPDDVAEGLGNLISELLHYCQQLTSHAITSFCHAAAAAILMVLTTV